MAGLCRPELPHARAAGRHGFGKGPFYADVGGFGALANDHIRLVDTLPNQISLSAGTLGEEEGFLGGTHTFASGDRLIAAADYEHLDGPWTHSDNFHKIAGRYASCTAPRTTATA